MHIAYISKDKKPDLAAELQKMIAAKWDRRDRANAERKYGISLKDEIKPKG